MVEQRRRDGGVEEEVEWRSQGVVGAAEEVGVEDGGGARAKPGVVVDLSVFIG